MNKRTFLKSLVGQSEAVAPVKAPMVNGFSPFSGNWTFEKARHLLNRTMFGVTKEDIVWSVNNGLEATVDRLLQDVADPDPPIYYQYQRDPNVALGETWVNTPADPNAGGIFNARIRSLATWWTGNILHSGMNITERMILFWHEHFAINNIRVGRYAYHYHNIIRRNVMGNFRPMIEEMTIDSAMLKFLNGDENTRIAPNENYARELLELFTIGRGELAGPGDYTNYTEQDVIELARALTGWRAQSRVAETDDFSGVYRNNRHDRETKTLSHRFDNVVIENEDDQEYKTVIDIILQKQEVARYLSRQLHLWFVGSNIDDDTEINVIEPMSQILFDSDYEIKPALRALLLSDYFNSGVHDGCMISSPIDFIMKIVNVFELKFEGELVNQYFMWSLLTGFANAQEMQLLSLPNVAGWKAYYQAPNFYKTWINSISLNLRESVIDELVDNSGNVLRQALSIDIPAFISKLDNPYEVTEMIQEIASILYPFPLADNQIDFLKNILIPGLPDYVWGEEYSNYVNFPDDEDIQNTMERKMQALMNSMLKLGEFYLH